MEAELHRLPLPLTQEKAVQVEVAQEEVEEVGEKTPTQIGSQDSRPTQRR